MANEPFYLSKRPESPYWQVRFISEDGKILPARSTRKEKKSDAVKVAWKWYSTGEIQSKQKSDSIKSLELKQRLKKSELTDSDVIEILKEAEKRGIITGAVVRNTPQDKDFCEYLLDFWDYDKSDYIREKLRMGKSFGRAHAYEATLKVKKYWNVFFAGKKIGLLTKKDLKDFMNYLDQTSLQWATKQRILNVGFIALRWAYGNELIDRDITAGIMGYSGQSAKREILTPEIAETLFSVRWEKEEHRIGVYMSKLANLLAMCTGMRSGEIRALRMMDLGDGCIYVNHSWNEIEHKLKSTKNGESRIIRLPFPALSHRLLDLCEQNPHKAGMESFVFWSLEANKPITNAILRDELHKALVLVGFSPAKAKTITFHAWRHFFASYMKDKIGDKLLQSQTGHKSLAMLEHYANHEVEGDNQKIQTAQIGLFGSIIENAEFNFIGKN